MKRVIVASIIIVVCIIRFLAAYGTQGKSLDRLLSEDPYVLEKIKTSCETITCEDYTVYHLDGGIEDTPKATRYAKGLIDTTDRFVNYQYIVKDNQSGWLYIFECVEDIPLWVKHN